MRNIILLLLISCITSCSLVNKTESRHYTLNKNLSADIQIRHYPQAILAKTLINGSRKLAANQGFKLLANYIFSHDISMTTPVTTEFIGNITNMTAETLEKKHKWAITFTMPASYSLDNLPTPPNQQVQLFTSQALNIIALTFSGTSSSDNLLEHYDQLKKYVDEHKIKVKPEPIFAFYNNPWTTLPPLRRNEVMLVLAE